MKELHIQLKYTTVPNFSGEYKTPLHGYYYGQE